MNKHNFDGLERVSKLTAKRLYNEGKDLIIVPNKFCPFVNGENHMGFTINKVDQETDETATFDKRINAFEYYNCNYETGYYTAFYKFL